MEELLLNLRPIFFGLVGFTILYYTHLNAMKRWDKKSPKPPSNASSRLILGCLAFMVIAFLFSAFLTAGLIFTLINTVVLTVFFVLYVSKVFSDAKKYRRE